VVNSEWAMAKSLLVYREYMWNRNYSSSILQIINSIISFMSNGLIHSTNETVVRLIESGGHFSLKR
jgi:hypothetical protein